MRGAIEKAPDDGAGASQRKPNLNDLDFATAARADKRFHNARADFAFAGYELHRTDPADVPVSLFAGRWGLVHQLADLDAAAAFLTKIGGRLNNCG